MTSTLVNAETKYIAVDLEFEILLQKSSMSNCIYIS